MNADGSDVSRAELHVAKVVIDTEGVRGDISVAKITSEAACRRKLHLVAGCLRVYVGLQPIQVKNRIVGKLAREHRGKNWLTTGGVSGWNCFRDHRIAERHGNARLRIDGR